MSKPTLYYMTGSPPANAVLLLIRHLGIDVEVKTIDFLKGEHKTPEFLKLNPAHEVPVLVDGDYVLTESRAILTYLVNSRKAGSDLYPTDAKKRGRVDQRLNYDQMLFVKLATFTRPILMIGAEGIVPKVRDSLIETVTVIDKTLENSKWIAGDNLTIADFSLATSIAWMATLGYDLSKHTNLARWYKQAEGFKGWDENIKGAQAVAGYLKDKFSGAIF